MNIFKILGSGHGNISETNVSAFLGYLLNPKADHGLNAEFLKAFILPLLLKSKVNNWRIQELLKDSGTCKDLSTVSKYDVQVYYEKAFSHADTGENHIVDIVIKIMRKNDSKQSGDSIFINSELVGLILVENKINLGSRKDGQLEGQYESTIAMLEKLGQRGSDGIQMSKDDIYSIFVTTNDDDYFTIWKDFEANIKISPKGEHLTWSTILSNDTDENINKSLDSNNLNDKANNVNKSIDKLLATLLEKESKGYIEPIPDQTKHTLKAFLNFILSGFKSIVDEENKGGKNEPKEYVERDDFFNTLENQNKPITEKLINLHSNLLSTSVSSFPKYNLRVKRISYYFTENGSKDMFFYITVLQGKQLFEINYLANEVNSINDKKHGDNKKQWFQRTLSPDQIRDNGIIELYKASHDFFQKKYL